MGVTVTDTTFSSAFVHYGINNYAGQVSLTGTKDALSTTISGLLPNTTYNYYVEATDLAGNTATGAIGIFTTAPSAPNVSSAVSYVNLSNSGSLDIIFSGSLSDSGSIAIVTLSGSSMSLEQLYTG